MHIDLTDAERVILANQHEILSFLDKDNKDFHAQLAANFRDGHVFLYKRAFEWVAPNLPQHQQELVLEALDMYRILRQSYQELSHKGDVDAHSVQWPGFDGNNESELLSFTQALKKADRYSETLDTNDLNSHSPMTDIYSRMLGAYKQLGKTSGRLSLEDIKAVLAARYRR